MRSCKSPFHLQNLSKYTFSAVVSALFLFMMGIGFQGCVVHSGDNHSARYKAKTPSNKNYQRHKPQSAQNQRPAYEEQHPSYTNRPPAHARAYEVAQGRPFTENEHPSSYGQSQKANKGKPYMRGERPSQKARNNRGNGSRAGKEKPLWGEDHPSSNAQGNRGPQGGPPQGDNRPSAYAKGNQGNGPDKGKSRPSAMEQGNQGRPGGPPKGKDRPSAYAKADRGNRGGPQQNNPGQQGGPPQGHNRPSQGKGKPSMDRPMASGMGSNQMDTRGKSGKGKPKDKGKQKETFANFSDQEDSSEQTFSPSENKGKPFKQNRDSARGPSGKKGREQFQPESTPEENIQVAKVERGRGKDNSKGPGNSSKKNREESNQEPVPNMVPVEQESPNQQNQTQQENIQVAKVERGRGKGNSKGPGKANKMNRGKRSQQTDKTAGFAQQEPAPTVSSPEPATTASFVPMVFDNSQRSIIQRYYQNSGSKKPGKGRGKKSRGPKRNKTSTVAKNDILTQSTGPLPRSLESQLPPPPPNTRRALYNQQVVLIERGTNRVLDVINVNN
jgi:hypothetical protein